MFDLAEYVHKRRRCCIFYLTIGLATKLVVRNAGKIRVYRTMLETHTWAALKRRLNFLLRTVDGKTFLSVGTFAQLRNALTGLKFYAFRFPSKIHKLSMNAISFKLAALKRNSNLLQMLLRFFRVFQSLQTGYLVRVCRSIINYAHVQWLFEGKRNLQRLFTFSGTFAASNLHYNSACGYLFSSMPMLHEVSSKQSIHFGQSYLQSSS